MWQTLQTGGTFGITLPDLDRNSSNLCNLTSHYIYDKLIELEAEYLAPRVLTIDSISEVSQYDVDMNNLTATPKYVKLPKSDKNSCGIESL